MNEEAKPRIDRVSLEAERRGNCRLCGRRMRQSKTFTGATVAECEAQFQAWGETEIQHARRCPQ